MNYFITLNDPNAVTSILKFLSDLYFTCENDYSTYCIESIFQSYGVSSNTDTAILSIAVNSSINLPIYYLNGNKYFRPEYIEMIYCLSSLSPQSSCETCNNGCSFEDLYSSSCVSACNVSSCGYSDLKCLMIDDCYSFMIYDDNCNKMCRHDQGCNNYNASDICAIGCYYSDMANGSCASACTGSCFSYCSADYCGPGCISKDWQNGMCNSSCSPNCSSQCQNQNTACNPECSNLTIISDGCPSTCSRECCSNNAETSTTSQGLILYIVLPSAVGGIIVAIIIA